MKKLLSLMLCLVLFSCMVTTAYATDGNSSTVVSLTVPEESYTLEIPPSVTIGADSRSGALKVSIKEVNLIWSDEIRVRFDAANAVEGEYGSYLKHTENENKIPYTIIDDYGSQYKKGGNSNYAVMGTNTPTDGTITLEVDSTYQYPGAGTYTDTLTFYVSFHSTGNG